MQLCLGLCKGGMNIKTANFEIQWNDQINITKSQWIELLQDRTIFKYEDIELLKLIYLSDNYMATASQLINLLDVSHVIVLNNQVGRLGKRIADKLNVIVPKYKYGEGYNWWHIPFLGAKWKNRFYWILREELRDAVAALIKQKKLLVESDIGVPEEIICSDTNMYEGIKKQIYVNRYERNIIARNLCIKHYGAKCIICGFDFEKVYGDIGKDIIHVHHIKPLHEIKENYLVNPVKDLRPVCPNCHLIIHKRGPVYSIEEVKEMILRTSCRHNCT